ncbi:hypothetical protein [Pseudovibrio sp. Tun.PSC04-5.I4]|uniref:hypothetical protein n=1 Tax=Pseudovibrio sp. Tun.PSC04-5.I4 TaxID=1798213 RepID=UPI00088B6439|nr:hypothetical protein [Pseudovibrio sp. Tun.PSC04-5.I4]SDR49257.1 hypothetical protein SAMN04515695_6156 [Pseudovibrio sp. Tun.PSC04-5.I4]
MTKIKSHKKSSTKDLSGAKTSYDRKADTLNANKGVPGQNKTRAKNQGNRGKQLNPNQNP